MSVRRRNLEQKIAISVLSLAAILTSLILVLIIGKIAIEAIPALSLHFITTAEVNSTGYGQVVGNALVGTLVLSLFSVVIAAPIAIGAAIYLKKYAPDNTFTRSVRFMIDVLSGMPSVVLGVFGFIFIVVYLKPFSGGFSLLSGALALSILITPVIERASEEAIGTVPRELEEGSYALGGTKWKTISGITIPYALSGIMTGVILGVGRSAEESAIVVLTAGYSQFYPAIETLKNPSMPFGISIGPFQEPIGVLSITVYHMFQFPNIVPRANGFAAALVLIMVVLIINSLARLILWRFRMNKNPAVDSGGSFNLSRLFKKIYSGNVGTSIPHIGIFNRRKTESVEKQIESIFSELHTKPENEEVTQSIRPYLIDPIKETVSSEKSDSFEANSSPTIETLPAEALQTSSTIDISTKSSIDEGSNSPLILTPPSDKPLLPVENTPYSVFVVDPVKITQDEILKNDSNLSDISSLVSSPFPAPSVEPILPTAPMQITELAPSSVSDNIPILIHEKELKKTVIPTIKDVHVPMPLHEVESSAGDSSSQLIEKEAKPVKPSNPDEKTANGLMSKTKDGKPFLDLLHPPSANNAKKDIITSSTLVSHVSDIAMPYTIKAEPDVAPAGLLTPGYVELQPSEDTHMSDSHASDEITPYNIISEPASITEKAETSVALRPMPEKINDITHKVKDPGQQKARLMSDFDLSSIFGGFKKNGKGNNGNNRKVVKGEAAATEASPTEDEIKSTMQKPNKKNGLLSGLNLSFSKPKEIVELLDFNVGKLSIPTLDGALKETDVTYEIDPPFQYVHVFFDGEEMSYNVLEPKLSDGEKKYLVIIERALEKLISAKIVAIRPEEREDFLRLRFTDIVKMYGFNLNEAHQDRMFYYIRKNYLGLSKIDVIMKDHYIEDISCNGPNNYLYVYHRVFGSVRTNVSFEELELNKFVMRLAQISGKHISILQPIKDVSMPDGSRANLTMGSEVTKKGATFTIRKFRDKPMSPVELMEYNSIDPMTLAYLWILLDYKKSILVSGGTASGKTTLLNVICSFIRPENKIVSLEDTAELNLVHPNWIQSVTRSGFGAESGSTSVSGVSGVSAKTPGDIGLYDLLVAALRQRPEFIICGEVRGAEAFTMFQAIAVGHACMGTIHAGTMRELLSRVESNPMNVPRTLFSALDVVCFNAMVRHGDRNVRRVMSVVEILELDADGDLVTNPVFKWDAKNDRFLFTGKSHIFEKIETQLGVSEQELVNEMQARGKFLRSLRDHNIRDYAAVVEKIHEYTLNHS